MTMPHASASLIPDHDDSVENENDKDFAPPPKKLNGEEEDNTPVVPMSQDSDSDLEEDVPKPQYTDQEARDAFKIWCQMFQLGKYADEIEYEKRFNFFKDSLHRKVSPTWKRYGLNVPGFADRSQQEIGCRRYCSLSIEEIYQWHAHDRQFFSDQDNSS